jgi:hypothetical protein
MQVRGTFAALALTALFALPTLASASIVQRWQSTPANYSVVSQLNDFNGDDNFEMLTEEIGGGGAVKIGVRSCSTGALLATTAATYQPVKFWLTNLEQSNGVEEIIFTDQASGNIVCLNYTTGATTLTVRWAFQPTPTGISLIWTFVDFDGTGQLYMAFKDLTANSARYYIRDNNGVLVTTIDQSAQVPLNGWSVSLFVDRFEADNRQELMIDYHFATPPALDVLYVFDNGVPAATLPAGAASASSPTRHADPAVRTFEPANGGWAEVGQAALAAGTLPHAVELR